MGAPFAKSLTATAGEHLVVHPCRKTPSTFGLSTSIRALVLGDVAWCVYICASLDF